MAHYFKDIKFQKDFGKHLKALRQQKGISRQTLAYRSHLPSTQILRIEKGEVNTGISTVHAIADALHIPKMELFDF